MKLRRCGLTLVLFQFFHQVALQDSGFMMRDSGSLQFIALITLCFLPITTVATICGSEFFTTVAKTSEGTASVRIDSSAWIMFTVSAAITGALMIAWYRQLNLMGKAFSRGPAYSRKGR